MKKTHLLAFLLLAVPFIARADDLTTTSNSILQNSDFSDGIAHWYGDVHTQDSSGGDDNINLSGPSSTTPAGVIVKLRGGDWTKVVQDFDANSGEFDVLIVYSVSSDLAFSQNPDDYKDIPTKLQFSRLGPFSTKPGNWALIINDLGAMHYTYWTITPKTTSGMQAIKAHIKLDSSDASKKGFYLVFPPGTGVITLYKILMVPAAPGTTSTPSQH